MYRTDGVGGHAANRTNARVPRFLEVPDPDRPGSHLEIGPIDVARLKALPTMRPDGLRWAPPELSDRLTG